MAERTDSSLAGFMDRNLSVDTRRGQLQFFGKNFNIDPKLAPFVDMGVVWLSTLFYQKGGTKAREWTTSIAERAGLKDNAGKLGTGAELLVRFGGPLAQTGANTIGSLRSGYRDMKDIGSHASVLLNANRPEGGGHVLTSKFTALAHKRAQVRAETWRGVKSSVIGAITQLPALLIGYNQFHLDRAPRAEVEEAKKAPIKDEKGVPEEIANHPIAGIIRGVTWLFNKDHRTSMLKPGNARDYVTNLHNLQMMPPVVTVATDLLKEHYLKPVKAKVVAWDYIIELEEYAGHHKRPDRDKIAVMVKQIVKQHIHDLGHSYKPEGMEYENAVSMIADAVQYGKLHPQAIAEILDNKKIVTFSSKDADFGDSEDVKNELTRLEEKYASRQSEKDFYAKTPFTKEKLVETFNNVPEEEKAFFVMLIPPGLLEKAGADADKVRRYRDEGKGYFLQELTQMMEFLLDKSRHELHQLGVKGKLIDELDFMRSSFSRAAQGGNEAEFVEEYKQKIGDVARDIGVSAGPDFWRSYIKERAEAAGQERAEPNAAEEKLKAPRRLSPRSAREMAKRDAEADVYRG